ncbi:Tumor necrosis factor receptor superfamily member 5 [Channa argus]|uniref:Tumor necrosis factor receptor superfamily member 5 n=1 Tax=Channa argus TaxID=215402 RepID=A0A6G1PI95_CHAAH|nr:Tumor necrosis factor receptor superfamily member 5 [Channa argus]
MIPLKLSLAAICMLNIWTFGYATSCGELQLLINGRCCEKCRTGEYLKEFCTENKQTVCSPCKDGFFSDKFNTFDRCEECQSCQQEYSENCTRTTNAKCLCRSGFLCSNNVCSTCEENKCAIWEKVKKTEIPYGEITKYSYQCESACPHDKYYDVKEDTCKPFTQCSALGLSELLRGNKTHDSVCYIPAQSGGGLVHVMLGMGFILLSVALLVLLSHACIKNLYKKKTYKANNNPTADNTNHCDIHLSKEESRLQFIIQDESKDSSSFGEVHLAQIAIP